MIRFVKFAALVVVSAALAACAGAMNPFQGEFTCPDTEKGKCISLKGAYLEDLGASKADESTRFHPDDAIAPAGDIAAHAGLHPSGDARGGGAWSEYRNAANRKVARLLREPVTPVVAPPQVMRVLILPYEDEDAALNLMRYTYIMVDRPKWVLGSYLAKDDAAGEAE